MVSAAMRRRQRLNHAVQLLGSHVIPVSGLCSLRTRPVDTSDIKSPLSLIRPLAIGKSRDFVMAGTP
jgi:hypothetical protein